MALSEGPTAALWEHICTFFIILLLLRLLLLKAARYAACDVTLCHICGVEVSPLWLIDCILASCRLNG